MSLTLSDGLSHYRSVSDTTHRFWGYFQAVAAGTAAFTWSQVMPADAAVLVVLGTAFAVFAVLNWRLVVGSQWEAWTTSKCIKEYAINPAVAVPSELLPLIEKIDPEHPTLVGAWHAGLSIATLTAVWWRYSLLAAN